MLEKHPSGVTVRWDTLQNTSGRPLSVRAALTSQTVKDHPEYYIFKGYHGFVDFGNPDAVDYIFGVLSAAIRKYGIRFIKFDFNARLSHDADNVSFLRYFAGYRDFLHRIRGQHPEVYIENCVSGGLRMALCSLADMDSFWISDNHSLYTQLDIFKNTMIRMPCRALEKWLSVQTIIYEGAENVEKILSSGDCVSAYESNTGVTYSKEMLEEEGVELYITTRYTAVSLALKKKA